MILGLTGAGCRLNSQSSKSGIDSKSVIKFRLFNLLTVCLATSGLLAPGQAAFGHSVKRQINLEEAQHLVCVKEGEHLLCDIDTSSQRNSLGESHAANAPSYANTSQEWTPSQEVVGGAKATESLKSSTVAVVPQLLTPAQQGSIANILLGFGYLLPCGTCLGIFLYDKYCGYRVAVLNKQIESLERLWKQSTLQ